MASSWRHSNPLHAPGKSPASSLPPARWDVMGSAVDSVNRDPLAAYRGAHVGASIAVLGSGPSLGRFAGQQPIAIAVNGAATSDVPYQYFACGDPESYQREWFYGSRRHAAKRIVAALLTPRDAIIYPSRLVRGGLRLERRLFIAMLRLRRSLSLHDYSPSATPAPGHGWFQYLPSRFPSDPAVLDDCVRRGRMVHGATIAGVALQLAVIMGGAEIHLYGCAMDNDGGGNYYRPGSRGRSTPLQRQNFATLVQWAEGRGVAVIRAAEG